MKKKRKPLVIVLICVAAVLLLAAGVWFFWLKDYLSLQGASPVYVNPISAIVGLDTGSNPRYSGIVQPQATYKVEKDESKTVAEVLVAEGDEVHVGDVLFRYDTEQLQYDLREAQLSLEGIANQISTQKTQLAALKAEKAKASKDEEYSYTVQIQSKEVQIDELEFNSTVKKGEIEKLQKALESTDVLSEYEGIVKEVNTVPKTDSTGQPAAFISILSSGEYRIKGTVSELNLQNLSEGQAVVVHSRIDPSQQWKGTVETIEREPSESQTNTIYYPGMDSGEKSSKYDFYVTLESLDGLILGQHVYIEPDLGEETRREGLWLPAVYVDHDESGSFVWAKNDKDKLEKRAVMLGDYDSENDQYEIKGGVTKADSIAYPSESLRPGLPTTMDAAFQDDYMGVQGGSVNGGSITGGDPGVSGAFQDPAVNGVIPEGGTDAVGSVDPSMYDAYSSTDNSYDDGTGSFSESGEGYIE